MHRYLINMSYIGTPFRGAQRQVGVSEGRISDPTTVQGQVEIGLKFLYPEYEPAVVLSSRTDSGVHALHTTMHTDLMRAGDKPYEPFAITATLNKYFNKHYIPVRIIKTYLVPNTFHCRHNAISRTYLYRLGIVKQDADSESMIYQHLPIQEYSRCLFISAKEFDVNKMEEAAALFLGLHDFRSFMHKSNLEPNKMTRKFIENIEIRKSRMLCTESYYWPYCASLNKNDYEMYDIIVKGKGFLQRQVRRTVASLIAVAQGIVTPRDIKFMLEIPSHRSWDPRLKTVPSHGLYLCEVAYSRSDLATFKDRLEN